MQNWCMRARLRLTFYGTTHEDLFFYSFLTYYNMITFATLLLACKIELLQTHFKSIDSYYVQLQLIYPVVSIQISVNRVPLYLQ